MKLKVYSINAFAKTSKGGNQAGVVLEADLPLSKVFARNPERFTKYDVLSYQNRILSDEDRKKIARVFHEETFRNFSFFRYQR